MTSSGPARDSEQAPLLADDNPNNDVEADGQDGNHNKSDKSQQSGWIQKAGHWLWNNIMVVAIILLLIGGIIALCVYFGVIYSSKKPSSKPVHESSICLTPACVLAASEIIENMSPRHQDIDPCTDFDKFVCEGWDEKHDLRADQGSSFTGTIMAENSQQILRHLLEAPSQSESQTARVGSERNLGENPAESTDFEISSTAKSQIFDKLQDAYNACMDEDQIKQLGAAPLLKILRKIEELFPARRPHPGLVSPVFDQDQKSLEPGGENKLSKTVTYLTSIGVEALVSFGVGADDKDPDVVVPFVNAPRQPGLPSKEYYKDPLLVARYAETIGRVLEKLLEEAGPNDISSSDSDGHFVGKSESLVEGIVVLESKLAKATPATENAEDVTKYYNPITLGEFADLLPQLSVKYLISTLASPGFEPTKLIVGSPYYLKKLSKILESTSQETLQAYFVWKTVQSYAYKVEDDALKPLVGLNNKLQGKDPDASEERWRTCIKVADNGLGWILSKFFVEKAFSKEAKNFGDRIVSDIKAQFIQKLEKADWMSKDVRELGIEKVHNIVQKIGYPTRSPDIRDSSALRDYYESVIISPTDYFGNALSIAEFDNRHEWSALGQPTNRDEWGMTADTVNAYYNPAGNEIVFPAGIMQPPVFYNPSLPQYLSYGAFGSVSGHELSHAFDSTGRHYDETGNYTDWWNNKTVESFVDKAQCFIDQYHNFTVPNPKGEPLHVNGKLTLGENIADAGGLNAAFAAWRKSEAKAPSQLLPGLQNYTKEQVFFISYSNWWCGKTRPESAVNAIYRDPHSPTWARIVGTMANSRDFKESFECPVKEPTCELW